MKELIGKQIGSGGCSEVFEWGYDKVIKLFRSNTTPQAVELEYRNSEGAWKAGLPVPRPYQLLDIEGRPGIVFDKIVGETLTERFARQLAEVDTHGLELLDYDIRMSANLIFTIHTCLNIPEVTLNQKEILKNSIAWPAYLTESEKQAIYTRLDGLAVKNSLCHGDPNPNNIIISNGEPVMIDWMNAASGNPAGDIAELIIMYKYAILPAETPPAIAANFDAARDYIIQLFVDEYMKWSGMPYKEIESWIVPVAARKLSADAISEQEKALLVQMIRENL